MKKVGLWVIFTCIVGDVHTQKVEIQFPFKKQQEMEIFIPKTDKMDFRQFDQKPEMSMVDSIPLFWRDKLLLRHKSYYMMNPLPIMADFERYRREIEQDSFYISPALWAPYTNLNPINPMLENDLQVEYMHGSRYLIPRPNYVGRGIPENRKSYREQRKLRMLKYITEEVYPTTDSIP